jgi:hypothetical protein
MQSPLSLENCIPAQRVRREGASAGHIRLAALCAFNICSLDGYLRLEAGTVTRNHRFLLSRMGCVVSGRRAKFQERCVGESTTFRRLSTSKVILPLRYVFITMGPIDALSLGEIPGVTR